ncbi:MAG TPA: putative manganese-dependent inorganic diphosphatase [Firmicutes bacterium]|nr:putative manganese-dependent inorganic diphosphatase [Candidatus Fermentithermobacillaceae bacterium]
MRTKIYLIGHRSPDTDSIASPIAYAHLKNETEPGAEHIPTRLGPLNRETRFVLDYFRVEAPMYIDNVYTQVKDLSFDEATNVRLNTSMRSAWELMSRTGFKSITVVDDTGKLTGIVTLGDIAQAYLTSGGRLSLGPVPVRNIVGALDGELLVEGRQEFRGIVEVVSHGGAVLGDGGFRVEDSRTGDGSAGHDGPGVLLIAGKGYEGREVLEVPGLHVVVLTHDAPTLPELLRGAHERGISVVRTPFGIYETTRRVSQSEPVSHIMTSTDLIAFSLEEQVDDIKETMLRFKYRYFPVLDDEGRPVGKIARRHVLDYTGKNVILVDHNETSQSVEGIEQARILEIIDHHRVGSIETDQPIVFINRPLGCTATIVDDLYIQRCVEPPKPIAGLMLAAILSDTLAFKSPTCTDLDVRAAQRLAQIAGVDVEEFVRGMFSAGTSLEGKSEAEIFFGDFKEFRLRNLKVGVSQVNTYHTDLVPLRQRLAAFMQHLRVDRGYDLLLLMLTDIIGEGSELLVVGNQSEIVERAFGVDLKQKPIFLPGVISRKKQVIPRIIRAINAM